MHDQQERDQSVELRVNFLAMTTDTIAAHALNGSNPQETVHLLENHHNAREWQRTIAALAFLTPICKQAPWLIPSALKLSVRLWMMVVPTLGRVVKLNRVSKAKISQSCEVCTLSNAVLRIGYAIVCSSCD